MFNKGAALRSTIFVIPVFLLGVILWSLNTQEHISNHLSNQAHEHNSVAQLMGRDIDDLEAQIQNSFPSLLPGSFSFQKRNGSLTATHSSLPTQPISITVEGEEARPFSKTLDSKELSKFSVYSDQSTLVSYSAKNLSLSMQLQADPIFLTESRLTPVGLSDVYRPRFTKEISIVDFLLQPQLSFMLTELENTNLLLASTSDLSGLWTSAQMLLLQVTLFSTLLWCLFYGFFNRRLRREGKAVRSLSNVFEKLKFGRIEEASASLQEAAKFNPEFGGFQRSLSERTALQDFFATKWINKKLRLVTWKHFQSVLRLWSEGQNLETDRAPSNWTLGCVKFSERVRSRDFVESLMLSFPNTNLFMHQKDEQTVYVLAGVAGLRQNVDFFQDFLDGFVQAAQLAGSDLSFVQTFVGHESSHLSSATCEFLEFEALSHLENSREGLDPQFMVLSADSSAKLFESGIEEVWQEEGRSSLSQSSRFVSALPDLTSGVELAARQKSKPDSAPKKRRLPEL